MIIFFLSIIIPYYRDHAALQLQIQKLNRICRSDFEIIIAATTEDPATISLPSPHPIRVVSCPTKGRAQQMNFAVDYALGDNLLFLHTDTYVTAKHLEALNRCLALDGHYGGAFRRRFFPNQFPLGYTGALADLRVAMGQASLGDQAQFIRREIFIALNGFSLNCSYEDIDLHHRLARLQKPKLLGPPVASSNRRFLGQICWQIIHDALVMLTNAWRRM